MLRSEFKSASFSSSGGINYDFKAEMSPFTKWVTDKSSRVHGNCNKQRNMATRKMNFYPRFSFLIAFPLRDSEPRSPSRHSGKTTRKGEDSMTPHGPGPRRVMLGTRDAPLTASQACVAFAVRAAGPGPIVVVGQDLRTSLGLGV